MLERFRYWMLRTAFNLVAPIDYSIKKGDFVTDPHWSHGPIRVVDVNWALKAGAFELARGSIVVWPLWGKTKTDRPDYWVD